MGTNPESRTPGFPAFLDSGSAASRRPGMTAESFQRPARGAASCRRPILNTRARHRPGGRHGVRGEFSSGNTSGSGRLRPDATRVSPPEWTPISATDPRLTAPGGAHVRASHLHVSNSTTAKPDRSGKSSAPGRRSVLPASKVRGGEAPPGAGAERRTHGRLAVGPVPSAEGTTGP